MGPLPSSIVSFSVQHYGGIAPVSNGDMVESSTFYTQPSYYSYTVTEWPQYVVDPSTVILVPAYGYTPYSPTPYAPTLTTSDGQVFVPQFPAPVYQQAQLEQPQVVEEEEDDEEGTEYKPMGHRHVEMTPYATCFVPRGRHKSLRANAPAWISKEEKTQQQEPKVVVTSPAPGALGRGFPPLPKAKSTSPSSVAAVAPSTADVSVVVATTIAEVTTVAPATTVDVATTTTAEVTTATTVDVATTTTADVTTVAPADIAPSIATVTPAVLATTAAISPFLAADETALATATTTEASDVTTVAPADIATVAPTATADIAVVTATTTTEGSDDSSPSVAATVRNFSRAQVNCTGLSTSYDRAKFYVIKPYVDDDVHKSVKYKAWSSTQGGNKKLDAAFQAAQSQADTCPVFLLFSVNSSQRFCGVAEMKGRVDFVKKGGYWMQENWPGIFPVTWHILKNIPNTEFRHILVANDNNKPITRSRDTQEVEFAKGVEMLNIFQTYQTQDSILNHFHDFDKKEIEMQKKRSSSSSSTPSTSCDDVVKGIKGECECEGEGEG